MSTATTTLASPATHSNSRGLARGVVKHDPLPPSLLRSAQEVTPVQCFPVVLDLATAISSIAPLPRPSTAIYPADNPQVAPLPFTYPKPIIMSGPRSEVRVIKARNQLVATDEDLASVFKSSVDAINKAVLRNACMFPKSLCFRLSPQEWHHVKSRINHKETDRGDWLTSPLAFSVGGAYGLSKIIGTPEAVRASMVFWQTVTRLVGSCRLN